MKQRGSRIDQQGRGKGATPFRSPKDSVHLAFCVSYVGSAFRGLQLQGHAPMHHTVEGVFCQALHDAGVLLKLEHGRIADPNHFLGRSCRTDRGVHAMRNLITLFIPSERFHQKFNGSVEEVARAVNAVLPPPIRVAAVTQVMSTFSAKNNCNRRVYRYLLPVYTIIDGKVDSWDAFFKAYPDALADCCCSDSTTTTSDSEPVSFINLLQSNSDASSTAASWIQTLQTKVEALNRDVTCKFVGSHRYHNYTVDTDQGGKMHSKSVSSLSDESSRVISRCEIAPRLFLYPSRSEGPSNVWMREMLASLKRYANGEQQASSSSAPDGLTDEHVKQLSVVEGILERNLAGDASAARRLPYVMFQVEGASFLLNMIRKMVGVTIAVARGTRATMVDDSLSPANRTSNPLAPGPYLGLSLSSYSGYDTVARIMAAKKALKDQQRAEKRTTADDSDRAVAEQSEAPSTVKKSAAVYLPLDECWNEKFGAQESTAAFFSNAFVPEVVDADLNRMVPLETTLYLRDAFRRLCQSQQCQSQDAACDSHLSSMKEYVPSKPLSFPPAASEMTIFLRMLRVHNWNIRPVVIPPSSKVAKEMEKAELARKRARDDDGVDVGSESAAAVPSHDDSCGANKAKEGEDVDLPATASASSLLDSLFGAPSNYDDGWLYVAVTREEELKHRWTFIQERFLSTKRMRREWGQTQTRAGTEPPDPNVPCTNHAADDEDEADDVDLQRLLRTEGTQDGD